MMEKQGITEELKVRDQMEWVRVVNGIRSRAGNPGGKSS